MSDAEPVATPRRLPVRWIVPAVLLLCLAWFTFQLFGMSTRIVVSKETTFITEPLGPDGLPDFSTYFFERGSEGVTPENNAAVLIWQATWPGDLDQEYWLPMADALGMKEVPTGQDSLVTVYSEGVLEQVAAELTKKYSSDLTDQEADALLTVEWQARLREEFADGAIDEAMSHPWTSKQLPALAKWAKDNRKPLDMLLEAAARPKYFSPSPSILDGRNESIVAWLLPHPQGMRDVARALQTRAMWHMGEGRTSEAWEDILACFRLARHTSRDGFLVEQLVGIAIEDMACQATTTLLQQPALTIDEAEQVLVDLQTLLPVSTMADALDDRERLMYIDIILRFSQGNMNEDELGGWPLGILTRVAIDWNHVLREGNMWYDRLAKAASLPSFALWKEEFSSIDEDVEQLSSTATGPKSAIRLAMSRKQRSQIMSNILVSLLLPALDTAMQAEGRAVTQHRLTLLAAALAVHRTQQGEYPQTLDELVPKILPQLPLDLYTKQPFIYERKDDGGYLLYSVLENGVDDGATGMDGQIINGEWVEEEPEDFDYGNSDLVIRVPEPAFKLPELPLDELVP